jgi:ubiquitin carboxyl-terminal hydrolase 25/28
VFELIWAHSWRDGPCYASRLAKRSQSAREYVLLELAPTGFLRLAYAPLVEADATQYFYTIKDLRDAVAPLLNSSRKAMDEDKLTDDDLKRHRVGGRLVTRKEILRSKKCSCHSSTLLDQSLIYTPAVVSELAELFWNLEHADIASVTPTMELAKLALVTSKDEEDDIEQTATDSSNDTDATLVEDSAPRAGGTRTGGTGSPVGSPGASSSSVLGKRARDKEVVASRMSIDSDNFVIISKSPDVADADAAGPSRADVEMKDAEAPAQSGAKPPPPLPQRKTSESVMMFGALIIRAPAGVYADLLFIARRTTTRRIGVHGQLRLPDRDCPAQVQRDGRVGRRKVERGKAVRGPLSSSDSTNPHLPRIYSLFYGTLRQRLIAPPTHEGARAGSTHDSENVFSILPVSVSDEGYDIYDGLSSYFHSTAQLDSNTVSMEITLVDLPPVLQIQLQVSHVLGDPHTGLCVLMCDSECNGTARLASRGSRRRTSSLERRFAWIGFWTARTPISGRVRKSSYRN